MKSKQISIIAARIAVGAPSITPEEIAEAVKTFKFELGNTKQRYVSDDSPYVEITGKFNFRGMVIPISFFSSGDFELVDSEIGDIYPLLESMDDATFENWIKTYSNFNWNPIFKAIEYKYGNDAKGLIGDKISDHYDSEAEQKDPYGYRGLKPSDFY